VALALQGGTVELPTFKYHPDPLKTDSIVKSDALCECCGKANGYIYNSVMYSEDDIENICPWCISNGAAASKFDGSFVDDLTLINDGLSDKIITEVTELTPGFNSWQQDKWLSHCGDACEFHGDADRSDLVDLTGEKLMSFLKSELIDLEYWDQLLKGYEKGGSPAVYKFKCCGCSECFYYMDFM